MEGVFVSFLLCICKLESVLEAQSIPSAPFPRKVEIRQLRSALEMADTPSLPPSGQVPQCLAGRRIPEDASIAGRASAILSHRRGNRTLPRRSGLLFHERAGRVLRQVDKSTQGSAANQENFTAPLRVGVVLWLAGVLPAPAATAR